MGTTPDEFESYLAPDESVLVGTSGTLYADSFRSAGTVGVTDRRLLFVSEGGRFLDAAHGAIHSIRSHPRRGFDLPLTAPALLSAVGAGVALAAGLGVLLLGPGLLGFLLLLVTVGGGVLANRIRRARAETDSRLSGEEGMALSSPDAPVFRVPAVALGPAAPGPCQRHSHESHARCAVA